MERIKITNHQLFSITSNAAFGGSVIVITAVVAAIAKQDAWISALLTPIFGMPVIWICWYLGSKYPGLSFVEIIRKILGKWVGTIVAASYVSICLTLSYHVPWYVGDFVTTQVMYETPEYVINMLFMIAVVIAILYGIETIARASEIYFIFVLILSVLTVILVSPNANLDNLQPVLENGIVPVLKGSYALSNFIIFPIILLMMIYPAHIDNTSEAKKSIFGGFLLVGFITFIIILMSILVLGSRITAISKYPTYLLAKEISLGIIFTRLEFIVAGTWIVTQFMMGTLVSFAAIKGLSDLLGLKDHKKIAIPMGLIILAFSEIVFPDDIYQRNWVNSVWMPYASIHGFLLPTLLFIVYMIKRMIKKAS